MSDNSEARKAAAEAMTVATHEADLALDALEASLGHRPTAAEVMAAFATSGAMLVSTAPDPRLMMVALGFVETVSSGAAAFLKASVTGDYTEIFSDDDPTVEVVEDDPPTKGDDDGYFPPGQYL